MPGVIQHVTNANRYPLFTLCVLLCVAGLASCSPRDDALERIQAAGVLYVGLDPSWPPFAFVDPASGDIAGLDVDLARAVGTSLGVEVQFVVCGWEGLYGALEAGRFDAIVSVLPYDPRRTRQVAYSTSYFNAGPVMVVPAGEGGIERPLDLIDCVVHVRSGSRGDEQARRMQKLDLGMAVISHDTALEALVALTESAGKRAAIVDAISARLFVRDDTRLEITGDPLDDELYVIAVDIEAESLQEAIDRALDEMRENGKLEDILNKWL
jgi:ABC-type amino acid transport substrate-binding protein